MSTRWRGRWTTLCLRLIVSQCGGRGRRSPAFSFLVSLDKLVFRRWTSIWAWRTNIFTRPLRLGAREPPEPWRLFPLILCRTPTGVLVLVVPVSKDPRPHDVLFAFLHFLHFSHFLHFLRLSHFRQCCRTPILVMLVLMAPVTDPRPKLHFALSALLALRVLFDSCQACSSSA